MTVWPLRAPVSRLLYIDSFMLTLLQRQTISVERPSQPACVRARSIRLIVNAFRYELLSNLLSFGNICKCGYDSCVFLCKVHLKF